MNFTAVTHGNELIGFECKIGTNLFFFGTKESSFDNLGEYYPALQFHEIKQVHGDMVILARSPGPATDADAHWTPQLNHAPVIATADCIPVLLSHPDFVCSIHAGWRGIQNEIVLKTIRFLLNKFNKIKPTIALFGPHIHKNSFEVDLGLAQVFRQLQSSYGEKNPLIVEESCIANKAHIDLGLILRCQLQLAGLLPDQIFEFSADTKLDVRFASFRREKSQASRNFSFVARLRS